LFQALTLAVVSWAVGAWAGYAVLGSITARLAQLRPAPCFAMADPRLDREIDGAGPGWSGPGWLVSGPLNRNLRLGFFLLQQMFDAATGVYTESSGDGVRVSHPGAPALYDGGLLWLTYWGFTKTPTGFIPPGQGSLWPYPTPHSSSLEETRT